MRSLAAFAAVACLALAGCSDGEEGATGGTGAPVPGEVTVAERGELAGALHTVPRIVVRGRPVRIVVENLGDAELHYGLSNRVERYVDGGWERALPPRPVVDVGLSVPPGQREGARYAPHVADEIELPADLEPGIYRVVKEVGPSLEEVGKLTLTATFLVRPVADVGRWSGELWGRDFRSTAVLEDDEPRALVPETRIEVKFRKERGQRIARWEAGCNLYGGKAEATTDRILISGGAGTLMGCAGALHDQDEWLADFFRSDPAWELSGERLTLSVDDTVIELTETPRGE